MSEARQTAIEAMSDAYRVAGTRAEVCGRLLDAIPDDVLARLSVERGAIIEECRCGHDEGVHGQTNEEMADNVCGACRDEGRGYGAVHDYSPRYRLG